MPRILASLAVCMSVLMVCLWIADPWRAEPSPTPPLAVESKVGQDLPRQAVQAVDPPLASVQTGATWPSMRAFLRDRYGLPVRPDDELKEGASIQWEKAGTPYWLCAQARRPTAKGPMELLAVCRLDREGFNNYINRSYRVDLYAFRAERDTLTLIARQNDIEYVVAGDGTEITIVRYGRDLYGFRIPVEFASSAHYTGFARYFTASEAGIRKVATIGEYETMLERPLDWGCRDYGLDAPGDPLDAIDLKTRITIDDRHPELEFWPWQVDVSGVAFCVEISQRHHVAFDPAAWRYVLPAELSSELLTDGIEPPPLSDGWHTVFDFMELIYGPGVASSAYINRPGGTRSWKPERAAFVRQGGDARRLGSEEDPEEFTTTAWQQVSIDGQAHRVLMVEGGNAVDVYLFRQQGHLTLVDSRRNVPIEEGWDCGPVSRSDECLVAIGPKRNVWTLYEQTGGGEILHYLLLTRSGFAEVGRFPEVPDESLRVEPEPRPSSGAEAMWPLEITVRDYERDIEVGRYRVRFDEAAGRYRLPPAIQRRLQRVEGAPSH